MFRFISVSALSLAALISLNAGQIQIGQTTGSSGQLSPNGNCTVALNCGLTTAYVTSPGNYSMKNMDSFAFAGAKLGAVAPTPFTGYTNIPVLPGTSAIAPGTPNVTFAMVAPPSGSGNIWFDNGAGPTSMTIPIGIFGVTNVWTMLNNAYGVTGANDTTLTFTFDGNAAGTDSSTLTTVQVKLINGQEIRDAVDCSSGCGSGAGSASTFATTLNASTTVNGANLLVSSANGLLLPSLTINTGNVYNSRYDTVATGIYAGTSGNLNLDDQGFNFGSVFANEYLVSIAVADNNGTKTGNTPGDTILTAVTVGTATPEPSSVLLMLSGAGLIAFFRFRRKLSA